MEKIKRRLSLPWKGRIRQSSTSTENSVNENTVSKSSTPDYIQILRGDSLPSLNCKYVDSTESTPVPDRKYLESISNCDANEHSFLDMTPKINMHIHSNGSNNRFLSKSASHATDHNARYRPSLSTASIFCTHYPNFSHDFYHYERSNSLQPVDNSPRNWLRRKLLIHSQPTSPFSQFSLPVSPASAACSLPWRDGGYGRLSRKQRRASMTELGFGKLESYSKLEKLGEGTYATVFKGMSCLTEGKVALKEIRLEHEEGVPCTAIREIALLKDLKHSNIVTLHDVIHTDKSLTLVFEYVECDLKQYLEECGNFMHMRNVQIFLFQLLRALQYCHKRKILHRDLKPQNLLIGKYGDLKLADFGLARAKSVPTKTYSNEVVTLWYRPPDVLLGSITYDASIDMWGVGCIFCEMTSGRPLFPGSSVDEELILIWRILGTPNEKTWPGISKNKEFINGKFPRYRSEPLRNLAPRLDSDGIELLSSFLKYSAEKRTLATEAMKSPYFYSLGPRIQELTDTASVFTLEEVRLYKNPGHRAQSSTIEHYHKRQPHHSYSLSMEDTELNMSTQSCM